MFCTIIVPREKVKELRSFDSLNGQVLRLFLSPGKLISVNSSFISLPAMIEPTKKITHKLRGKNNKVISHTSLAVTSLSCLRFGVCGMLT